VNHVPGWGRQRPRAGKSRGHAWGTLMAVRGDFQWPPMGRMAWPPSPGAGRVKRASLGGHTTSRQGATRQVTTTRRRHGDREYTTTLLRQSDPEGGKVRHRTLANLSYLPETTIELVKASLAGTAFVPAGEALVATRSLPHGDVAAVWGLAEKLGLKDRLGPPCRERDVELALICSEVVEPAS